jgi:16S rRNA (guanine966-N2)-methyltransferase
MRIIGGEASGRRLSSLSGTDTRPTGDRVREALFNIWQGRIAGARFLDAYAGTGAMGLEALSRGAQKALFVEPHAGALRTLKRNVELVGVKERAEIWGQTAEAVLPQLVESGQRFDVIFCDPPWRHGVSAAVRAQLPRLVDNGGLVVVESRQSDSIVVIDGLEQRWTRRYGDTRVTAYGLPLEEEEPS